MASFNFSIPDIELTTSTGRTVSPSMFAGHALVLVFCPTAAAAEARETAEYKRLGCDFAHFDAWLLTVCERGRSEIDAQGLTTVAHDPEGIAWSGFAQLAGPSLDLKRDEGATFLFERGGSLRRVWSGPGHARDALQALADRRVERSAFTASE